MCHYMFHNIFSINNIILISGKYSHLDFVKSFGRYKFAPTKQDYAMKFY